MQTLVCCFCRIDHHCHWIQRPDISLALSLNISLASIRKVWKIQQPEYTVLSSLSTHSHAYWKWHSAVVPVVSVHFRGGYSTVCTHCKMYTHQPWREEWCSEVLGTRFEFTCTSRAHNYYCSVHSTYMHTQHTQPPSTPGRYNLRPRSRSRTPVTSPR